jgi:hypothetical protein
VFGADSEGSIAHMRQLNPGADEWSGWQEFGPAISGRIAVCQNVDNCCEVFALDADGALAHTWQTTAFGWVEWGPWERIGPQGAGDVVLARNLDGRLEVFATGPDGRIGHAWRVAPRGHGGWSDWEVIGPKLDGCASIGLNVSGRLELFARSQDGQLGHQWQVEPAGWSAWTPLGTTITSDPVVSPNVDGHLELFARGEDGRLGHLWQNIWERPLNWSNWSALGPEISGAPVVCPNIYGQLEVFARDSEGRLGHMWQLSPNAEAGWSVWTELGPVIAGEPAVGRGPDGRLEVFAVTPDGMLGHTRHLEPDGQTGWSPWELLDRADAGVRLAVCEIQDHCEALPPQAVKRPGSAAPLLRADYCVIGAGPAGITIADRLARAGATVVMVESGGFGSQQSANALTRGVATGPLVQNHWRYLSDGRRRQVGGSTSGWGRGWLMPFRDGDFARREWVDHSGWPLSRAELASHEARAADTFGFGQFSPPRHHEGLDWLTYQFPPDGAVFAPMLHELLELAEFHCELGMTAVELEIRGERIESVLCASMDGEDVRVAAGAVVLAAGAIENARQLLLRERDLPVSSPSIGRCFMEHPVVLVGTMGLPDDVGLESLLEPITDEVVAHDVLALEESRIEAERILSASVQLRRHDRPDGAMSGACVCDLYLRAEQAPNYDSRVLLGKRSDPFGLPRASLRWELTPLDWASVIANALGVAALLERHYGGTLSLAVRAERPWLRKAAGPGESASATWGFHHMGTTRMSETAESGVVDRDCRVHGMANLYVAGSSVFPTGSSADPTFTIVALAHRLAEHLLDAG